MFLGGKKKSNQKGQNGRKGKNTNAYYEPVVWTQEDINYASHLAAQQM